MKIIITAALVVLFLAGCATVQTQAPAAGAVARGVSYYLPRRDAKITVDRTIVKLEDAKKKVAAARKAVDESEAADKSAAADLKNQEALLPTLPTGTDAWKNVEAARATAAGKKILAAAALSDAKANLALAQADQARVEAVAGAQCIYKYDTKLELLAAVPDHDMRFVASFAHNALRDDDAKLAVTPDGLLTSSNAVAADRTGDIIVELAGAIAGFGSGGGMGPSSVETNKSSPDCNATADKFVHQFDPAAYESVNEELKSAHYPVQLQFQNMNSEGPACQDPVVNESYVERSTRFAKCAKATISSAGGEGALFYRSAVPVTVIVKQCDLAANGEVDCAKARPVDAALVLLPQLGPISYIPMRSSAFVKTVDDVTFSNGSITSWNATRPSEVLEVVRLPVRLLTAIISVPAQIISLRVNLSDKDKALAESQKAQMLAQQKLSKLKTCVSSAEHDGTSADSCFVE